MLEGERSAYWISTEGVLGTTELVFAIDRSIFISFSYDVLEFFESGGPNLADFYSSNEVKGSSTGFKSWPNELNFDTYFSLKIIVFSNGFDNDFCLKSSA